MAKRNKNKNKLPYSKEKNLVENFSPKTEKQEELVNLINNKEVTIVKGPSGSGKTYTTLATALNLLGDKYKQIILKEKIYLAKIKRAIKKHKFITTVSLAFIVFSSLNIIMIYNFFEILQNT